MRLSCGLLLPAIAGVVQATSAAVDGFVFTASKELSQNTVSLSQEQVRLALAQQLDVTQYHSLNVNDMGEKALGFINTLGAQHPKLFDEDTSGDASPKHLVVFLDISPESSDTLKAEWHSRGWTKPSFIMRGNPGRGPVKSLVKDIQKQMSPTKIPDELCTLTKAIEVSANECWYGNTGHIMYTATKDSPDFATFMRSQDSLFSAIENGALEVTFLLITPLHNNHITHMKDPWGSYSVPVSVTGNQRRQTEEPMSEAISSSSTVSNSQPTSAPIRGLPPLCYNTMDSCTTSTRNCSGHGACFRKFGPAKNGTGPSCFSCACYSPDASDPARKGHWGGAACQKKDISAQFWIIAGFSALLVGVLSWAIGMMFSIGSEKLPGVIGAGVAAKTR